MTIWFIADTHFGHTNILQYEDRPFKTVEEMDESLIENWNSVVKGSDYVFHLGDFALCRKERIIEIIARLNGNKYIVCGNHDRGRSVSWWKRAGFVDVVKFPETVSYPGALIDFPYSVDLVLSHIPIPNTTVLNVHGHIHANKHRAMPPGDPDLYRCVSVEQTNFHPLSLEEVLL